MLGIMKRLYTQICQVDTVYSLFLYLILFPRNIVSTFFFFGSGIPDIVKEQFKGHSFIIKKKQGGVLYSLLNICRCWVLLPIVYLKYRLYKKVSYGQDHLIFAQFVISNSLFYILLEDGVGNYTDVDTIVLYKKEHYFLWKLKSIINSLRGVVSQPMGFHPKIKKIYLSGMMEVPPYNREKIEIFSLQESWGRLSVKVQNEILHLLCANEVLLKKNYNYDILLLTQCFSEDGMIDEDKKIQMYRDILQTYFCEGKKVCIKSHPREKTDYKSIFPFAEFIPSYIPFELLVLMSKHNIKSAITVNSTAIYSLDKSVEKVILGMGYLQKYRNE